MVDEREVMLQVAKKQKDCVFSLRFVLRKNNDVWNNLFMALRLVKKEERSAIDYDYGDYVLGEKFLSIEEGLSVCSHLFSRENATSQVKITGYGEFPLQSIGQSIFVASRHKYGLVRSEHPTRSCEFRVIDNRTSSEWNRELLKEGLPYYPNLSDAIIDYLGFDDWSISSYGTIYVIVPDYRARIDNLKLSFSKAEVKLHSPELAFEDLIVKAFAKSDGRMISIPDMIPASESVIFDIGFQPDFLSVALVSRSDGAKIDSKEFSKRIGSQEGVEIERPEDEILSLTKIGEGQDLEYKYDIKDETSKNDFIETVVAFSNTNRGTILVGVADNGDIVGTRINSDDVHKMIHDNCDPPLTHTKIEQKEIAGNKVIIIEVPEGSDKPYQSRRDKNWYVRHNANDMKMERSELIRFWQERTQVISFP